MTLSKHSHSLQVKHGQKICVSTSCQTSQLLNPLPQHGVARPGEGREDRVPSFNVLPIQKSEVVFTNEVELGILGQIFAQKQLHQLS
jgi:hypothetical protein